ncbi:uroporphyrinogen decarboxylase family protein [Candidatus Hydrogenedentota bacterium]
MTPRERVNAALKREPVDRVPVFMWFHPETARRLAELLEIPPSFVAEAMGDDIRQTWVNNNYAMEGIVHDEDGETHVDYWGIKWVKDGPFNQVAEYPLLDAENDELMGYEYPRDHIEDLLAQMKPVLDARKDWFVGCDVSPCCFEMYWRLRSMDKALMDMIMAPEIAREMFKRAADFAVALGEAACDRFELDWLWTGDDIGGQNGMMVNPDLWRDMVKPHLKRVFDVGASRDLWVAFHSCGAIRPIVDDLVEMGLHVLNPIQCNCDGMDPLDLKKEFGDKLSFMGGVDTQGVLPFGTENEVRKATARLLEGMTAEGGGYILAASHTVPPETPDANIFAMYEEAGISKEEILDRASDIRVTRNHLARD